MQLCLYDPNKRSKGHFVPRVGTISYLDFSLSKKGVDILQLSYCSIGMIFSGKLFMVKRSYNNITIFHFEMLNSICSYNCTKHYFTKVYKLRRVKDTPNFISSGSKIVKRLRRRQYDPLIIETTIGLVLGPSTALYIPFLKHCTQTNKAVWTI